MKKKFRIALGADHAGFETKQAILKMLLKDGYTVMDCGSHSTEPTDYPDFAIMVAKLIQSGRCERGILSCGTGIGMSIAANKMRKIRAGVCWKPDIAALAAQHNWVNVLCLPSRFVSLAILKKIVMTWLKTEFDRGGRHQRRVTKINRIDAKN